MKATTIIMIIMVALVISLAGCGQKNQPAKQDTAKQSQKTKNQQTNNPPVNQEQAATTQNENQPETATNTNLDDNMALNMDELSEIDSATDSVEDLLNQI